jgi:glycosyltransferase involved in cell wall biosynthesis
LTRRRLIVIGPVPPPLHGVTISTSLVLANRVLHERFDVEHLDTSDHRSRENVGRWELRNVVLGIRDALRLGSRLPCGRGVVYLPISQSTPGFIRDSLFLHLSRLAGWKVALHLRGGEFRRFYALSPGAVRWWIRLTMRRVTSAAVMGPSLMGEFEGLVPTDRIVVVPNGTPDLEPDGASRDPERVLFLSNLRRRKGVVESVDAALRVIEQRPSARFLFVGDWEEPELEAELRTRAQEAGDAISFVGSAFGTRKRELLLRSSVLLFPPKDPEGHPRVVLEALSAGLPVVTTRRGAIVDTISDGESGFVLSEADPEQLAARTLQLLADASLRERMSRAARETYLERFTQERADRILSDWLQDVALAS